MQQKNEVHFSNLIRLPAECGAKKGQILMGIVISLLALAAVLAIDWFAAKTMYEIAVMKGHPQKKYFWWCFWMAIFGYQMVIALPDRRGAQAQTAPSADELPEL